jgi:ketosteroid isomerase-like protein
LPSTLSSVTLFLLSQGREAEEPRVNETDDFLAAMIPRQVEADTALHNGEAAPRMALWSHRDPVTVLGAAMSATGWDDIGRTFEWIASRFSNCESFDLDIIAAAASGDLAYTVGYEHTKASIDGPPQSYTLRVTHTYRREDGEWKIAPRHADAATAVEIPTPSDAISTNPQSG